MWYRVYADGTEIDIIYANSEEEAIKIAEDRHGTCDNWIVKQYPN